VTAVHRRGAASRSVVEDDALASGVCAAFGEDGVLRVERELSRYSTSATIEDVSVHLTDGSVTMLILKDLSPDALLPEAAAGKPELVARRTRELTAYRSVLRSTEAATCHAAVEEGDRRWLLLEKVPGVELYQVGEVEVWAAAAAAVARMHHDLTSRLDEAPELRAVLLRQDPRHLAQWMDRALAFEAARGGARLRALERLAHVHPEVVARLSELPDVVLHGDLYASNVLVVRDGPLRVCPIDWELASLGPGVLDLAALTSGGWSAGDRETMASAYWAAMGDARWRPSRQEFATALDLARLQLCVQWLGWAPDWTPPEEHAHDWLREASALTERLFG
jgi:Ser/Thr protein kinase RdoA (MazF antagonist)